jgi:PKD repeat protein
MSDQNQPNLNNENQGSNSPNSENQNNLNSNSENLSTNNQTSNSPQNSENSNFAQSINPLTNLNSTSQSPNPINPLNPLNSNSNSQVAPQPNSPQAAQNEPAQNFQNPTDFQNQKPDSNTQTQPTQFSTQNQNNQASQNPPTSTLNSTTNSQSQFPQNPQNKPLPPKNKRLILGLLAAAGCGFVLFVIMMVIGIQQIGPDSNPIAQAMGIDPQVFVNLLVSIVHVFFFTLSFLGFVAALIGVFRAINARKDDPKARGKALMIALGGGVSFLLTIAFWFGIYNYIDSKRVLISQSTVQEIITDPIETIGLTAPVSIAFDASQVPYDTRKYRLLSLNWDFGDGQKGTGVRIIHEYARKGETGRYLVTLNVVKQEIATGEEVTDTFTKDIFIANEKVMASFTATPESGAAPLAVELDGSESKDPDGTIISYEWDLDGDGQFDQTGQKIKTTYEKIGDYTVTLRVTDNSGDFAVTTKTIAVSEAQTVTPVIEIDPQTDEYEVGKVYTFKADKSQSPNGRIVSYSWDFGDGGNQATSRTASHTFVQSGTYTVTLTVTDEDGESAETTQEIKVAGESALPSAVIETTPALTGGQLSGQAPLSVQFSAAKSSSKEGQIVDYQWDFDGDGKKDLSGEKVNFVFRNPGVYETRLTITDSNDLESSATIQIEVTEKTIQAALSATPVQGSAPLIVEFDASASSYQGKEISSYQWDFGDGSNPRIDSAKVTYRYTKIGTFTATVTAIGSDNKRDSAEIVINIRPVPLKSCFSTSRTQGAAPMTVVLDPSCATGSVSSYLWTFGDGNSSRERKPAYTYTKPGAYKIKLEVSDSQNVIDVFEQDVLVTGEITQ